VSGSWSTSSRRSIRATFGDDGKPRILSPHGGVDLGDPIAAFNELARAEGLELADVAAAERYAAFVLDGWLGPFHRHRWHPTAEAAWASMRRRSRLEEPASPVASGPLGVVASEGGFRLIGGYEGAGVIHAITLDLARDGTLALDEQRQQHVR
jgi:hypothetical protein